MLNKEIIIALEHVMSKREVGEENQEIIKKFLNALATNSLKEKSEREDTIRNILSRLGREDGT